jgi:hypothetical protein
MTETKKKAEACLARSPIGERAGRIAAKERLAKKACHATDQGIFGLASVSGLP